MEFAAAAHAFADHLAQVRRLSPATVRAYRSDLRDLAETVGELEVDQVTLETPVSYTHLTLPTNREV